MPQIKEQNSFIRLGQNFTLVLRTACYYVHCDHKLLERQRKHTNKVQTNTGNNNSLMKPKCLVFEVSFLRTFDSKKQGQVDSQ